MDISRFHSSRWNSKRIQRKAVEDWKPGSVEVEVRGSSLSKCCAPSQCTGAAFHWPQCCTEPLHQTQRRLVSPFSSFPFLCPDNNCFHFFLFFFFYLLFMNNTCRYDEISKIQCFFVLVHFIMFYCVIQFDVNQIIFKISKNWNFQKIEKLKFSKKSKNWNFQKNSKKIQKCEKIQNGQNVKKWYREYNFSFFFTISQFGDEGRGEEVEEEGR